MVSVIVCTRNRLASLKRCIEAFERVKTEHDWQLIIVDNASTDGTREYLYSLSTTAANGRVTVTAETRKGLSRARNKGIATSQGEIVAFTDDDCYVTSDYITELARAFREYPNVGFLGGRILPYDESALRVGINDSEVPKFFPPKTAFRPGEIHGANMAFRRGVLNAIGGFDPRLGAGAKLMSAEDTAALADALWAGFAGVYAPKPIVYHHRVRKTPTDHKIIHKQYDIGRGAYYVRNLLKTETRVIYAKEWIRVIVAEQRAARLNLRSHLGVLGRRMREVRGGLGYALPLLTHKGELERISTLVD